MKRYMYFFVFLFLLFLDVTVCFADECNSETLKNKKKQVEVITVSSEFNYDVASVGIFNENIVTVMGLNEDIYAILKDHSLGFYYEDSFEGVVTKKVDKTSKTGSDILEFYSKECPNTVLRTIQLDLKKYNVFSGYEECSGIDGKDLSVCDSFYDKELTYEEFVSKVEDYKKEQNQEVSSNTNNFILNFVMSHIIWFVIAGLLLIVVFIFVILKKIKSYRLD